MYSESALTALRYLNEIGISSHTLSFVWNGGSTRFAGLDRYLKF